MNRIILAALIVFGLVVVPALPALASTASWQHKGGSLYPTSNTDFASDNFKQSIRDLKDANANNVTLIIPYYQSNLYTTDVAPGWNTPTDESLAAGIDYAHSLGLKVMLKPHLESYTHEWRANINPGDRDTWFRNYGEMLKRYARIAQAHNVETFSIGAELISMSTATSNGDNTWRWQQMISNVRALYSGKLTYSANWGGYWFGDEKNHIDFWGNLDYVGISAYFNLDGDGSVESLKNAWNNWNWSDIKPLADRTGKPILFTEIGYRSMNGSHRQPWDYNNYTWVDPQAQANAYEALFSYWNSYPYMVGADIWDWNTNPNAGGTGDGGYTPQNKPAEDVMRRWWSGGGTVEPPNPPNNPAFNVTGSANPNNPSTGQSTNVSINVKNNGGAVSNSNVDIEIYKGSERVFQYVINGQSINNNETKSYSVNWTPGQSGEHTVKVGIFKNDWTQTYGWIDPVSTIQVATGGTSNNSGPAAVDIWWPGNGVTVGGQQPFKAAIYDRPLSDYKMYWQVDGDRLNEMFDDQSGYPHKEVLVDLSGWNWKSSNSYTINFVAKTNAGATIGEKSTTINVSH